MMIEIIVYLAWQMYMPRRSCKIRALPIKTCMKSESIKPERELPEMPNLGIGQRSSQVSVREEMQRKNCLKRLRVYWS
jgi:hypothetical protein